MNINKFRCNSAAEFIVSRRERVSLFFFESGVPERGRYVVRGIPIAVVGMQAVVVQKVVQVPAAGSIQFFFDASLECHEAGMDHVE